MQNSEQKKKLLTTGDIAAHCEVSYETVANWIKGGKLKSHQTPGGHRRIRMEDFIDYLSVHDMPPLNAPADPNQRRILVVDDEPGILKLITPVPSSAKRCPTRCALPATVLRPASRS